MNRVRKLLIAIGSLFLMVVIGVLGFWNLEPIGWIDAFYMTIITMSTVGYGEVAGGFTPEGKLFASFLIIFTIGIFAYTITTITTFIIEGEIQKIFKSYRVNKEVTNLRNHIIICGLGRNGREAAQELIVQGQSYLAVERNQDALDSFLQTHPKALYIKGDATEDAVLEMANLKYAKGVITALAEDADNIFVALSVREQNKTIPIVARASNESSISKLRTAGATHVVVPNMMGGQKMANVLTKPALIDFIDMITGQSEMDMHLEQVDVQGARKLEGRTLAELQIRSHSGCMVIGLRDVAGRVTLNPDAHKPLNENQQLFIIGRTEEIKEFWTYYID